jgi:tRNA pseudouridine55 synthase
MRIDALTIVAWSPPHFTLDITCSAGTYIRSLAHDLGEALGVGAHLASLTRTASGRFILENAIALDALSKSDWAAYTIPPETALSDRSSLHLSDEESDHLIHGRSIEAQGAIQGSVAFAYAPDGRLVAVVQAAGSRWQPHKVFS